MRVRDLKSRWDNFLLEKRLFWSKGVIGVDAKPETRREGKR